MAEPSGRCQHLDAAGPRSVVYCHQCENEWYQDERGLTCPRCEGEITEIVSPDCDPRPTQNAPQTPPGLRDLHNHNPWGGDISDPEEADIADVEEHVGRTPGGSVFISQTIRSRPRRLHPGPGRPGYVGDPTDVMRDFHNMIGNLMGPGFQPGPHGRSGHDDLFPPRMEFHQTGGGTGPGMTGGTFTFTTGNLRPRDVNGPQAAPDLATYASPSLRPPLRGNRRGRPLYVISVTAPPDQLASIIGGIFGGLGSPGVARDHDHNDHNDGMPPGLQGFFASLFNPANARAGDAVYSQEALDQIISTLMEQHPTSNAPGPASPDAIAALPKKKLNDKLLGPEGKGECSVCMDDVHTGDEVVMLPCNHWFHEVCAASWLGEHNTCPICRKGIEGDAATPSNNRRSGQTTQTPLRHERLSRRMSLGSRLGSRENTATRNEARLDSIRSAGRLTPSEDSIARRWQVVGDGPGSMDYTRAMPGTFSSSRRDSDMNVENQRDSRRGDTSGSDRSRDSQRSSGSHQSGSGGPIAWLRDRFSSNDRRRE